MDIQVSTYAIPGIPELNIEGLIIHDVIKVMGVSLRAYKSKDRHAPLPMARAIACFVLYMAYDKKINIRTRVGVMYVDRCTFYHYIKMVTNIIETKDKEYYAIVLPLLKKYAIDYYNKLHNERD